MSIEKHLRGEQEAFRIIEDPSGESSPKVDFAVRPSVNGGEFTAKAATINGDGTTAGIQATGKDSIIFDTKNIINGNKTLTFPNISGEIMVKGSTDALSVSSGGTGLKTITANALLFGNGTSSINLVPPVVDTVTPTVKHFLNSTHNAKAPVWSKITWNDITDGNTITTSVITNAIALRHTQNTDSGTSSESFYLGVNANAPYLRNNAGALRVTDSAGTLKNIEAANITAQNVSAPTGTITAPNIPNKASSTFWGTAQYSNGIMTVTINDSWATTVNLTNGFSLGFISPSDTTLAATKITLINSALPPGSQTLFTAKDIYIDSANKIKANSLKGAVQLRYNGTNFFLASGGGGENTLGINASLMNTNDDNITVLEIIPQNKLKYETSAYNTNQRLGLSPKVIVKKTNGRTTRDTHLFGFFPGGGSANARFSCAIINKDGEVISSAIQTTNLSEGEVALNKVYVSMDRRFYIINKYYRDYNNGRYFKGFTIQSLTPDANGIGIKSYRHIGGTQENSSASSNHIFYSEIFDFCVDSNQNVFVLTQTKTDGVKLDYYKASTPILNNYGDIIPNSSVSMDKLAKIEVIEYNGVTYLLSLFNGILRVYTVDGNNQLVLYSTKTLQAGKYGDNIEILENGLFWLSGYTYNITNLVNNPSTIDPLYNKYNGINISFVKTGSFLLNTSFWGSLFEIKDSFDQVINKTFVAIEGYESIINKTVHCDINPDSENGMATIVLSLSPSHGYTRFIVFTYPIFKNIKQI